MTEIIRSLRECVQRIADESVAHEMTEKLELLQQAALDTHDKLHMQQRQLKELGTHAVRPNTLSAIWPGLCYDPAV